MKTFTELTERQQKIWNNKIHKAIRTCDNLDIILEDLKKYLEKK